MLPPKQRCQRIPRIFQLLTFDFLLLNFKFCLAIRYSG